MCNDGFLEADTGSRYMAPLEKWPGGLCSSVGTCCDGMPPLDYPNCQIKHVPLLGSHTQQQQ